MRVTGAGEAATGRSGSTVGVVVAAVVVVAIAGGRGAVVTAAGAEGDVERGQGRRGGRGRHLGGRGSPVQRVVRRAARGDSSVLVNAGNHDFLLSIYLFYFYNEERILNSIFYTANN